MNINELSPEELDQEIVAVITKDFFGTGFVYMLNDHILSSSSPGIEKVPSPDDKGDSY